MNAMDKLITWLRAQLDEDEQAGRAVTPLGYTSDLGGRRLDEGFAITRAMPHGEDGRYSQRSDPAAKEHFLRHDPARVLRRIAAERAIVDAYELIASKERENAEESARHSRRGPGWSDADWAQTMTSLRTHGWERSGQLVAATHMVKCLASAYADRPGYREEWRP